jgi:hypothetical protein
VKSYLVDGIQSLHMSGKRRYEPLKWQHIEIMECQGLGGIYTMRLDHIRVCVYVCMCVCIYMYVCTYYVK